MKELEKIESICPSCNQEGEINKIDAKIVEEGGKVWIIKNVINMVISKILTLAI